MSSAVSLSSSGGLLVGFLFWILNISSAPIRNPIALFMFLLRGDTRILFCYKWRFKRLFESTPCRNTLLQVGVAAVVHSCRGEEQLKQSCEQTFTYYHLSSRWHRAAVLLYIEQMKNKIKGELFFGVCWFVNYSNFPRLLDSVQRISCNVILRGSYDCQKVTSTKRVCFWLSESLTTLPKHTIHQRKDLYVES